MWGLAEPAAALGLAKSLAEAADAERKAMLEAPLVRLGRRAPRSRPASPGSHVRGLPAEAASPPNYRELAKIGRETAVVYAWRGDDRRAAAELLPALAYASLAGDAAEVAKIIAEFGRIELEAQRFKNVAMLFGDLVSQGSTLKLPPREAQRVRVNLCQALNRLRRHEEAVKASKEAIRLDPDYAAAHYNLGVAHGELGQYDEATEALKEAARLDPEAAYPDWGFGWLYAKQGLLVRFDRLRISPELVVGLP